LFVVEELLKSISSGSASAVFSRIQLQIAPVVNPDGYQYSHVHDRYWRKNRRPNDDGSYGVDLNRNFANHWGEGGASKTPSSETYRGPSAFSEPEVLSKSLRRCAMLCVRSDLGADVAVTLCVVPLLQTANIAAYLKTLSRVEAAIDFHAYGQLILRPYGWATPKKATPANDAGAQEIADAMRDAILAVHGEAYTSEHAAELYVASGGADDYLAADVSAQRIGLTLELRDTGEHGFVLPPDQIVPTGQEVLAAVNIFLNAVAAKAS
jgi:hypothetical protein